MATLKNIMDLPVEQREYYCMNCICPADHPDLANKLCGCGNPIHATCYGCEYLIDALGISTP